MTLLKVEDLEVSFSIHGRELKAVRGISFELNSSEAIGIVGESGCGKSTAMQALTRLIRASKIQGKALYNSRDLLLMSEEELRRVRGKEIGMIFQDPMTSLNPTMKVGSQICEGLLFHKMATVIDARSKALELLKLVQVPEPNLRLDQYPHQLSGGLRQRVLIAIALACNPKILIADEPTTALDVTIQAQLLHLLKEMQRHFKMGLILITHDLGVVSSLCDRILVMYGGKIVEQGTSEEILLRPRHPYTQMLLRSRPRLDQPKTERLSPIGGSPPNLLKPPSGCPFEERCPKATPLCASPPPFFSNAACWLYKEGS
ncbi:MAG: ABC transporter ATP-binding protein [Verrucomicrobia bacterium]|nr:ABC transporter ATP-binding protein [Verrucomicrobiota bacterium]